MTPISQAQLQDPSKASSIVESLFEKGHQLVKESRNWPLKYTNDIVLTRCIKLPKDSHKYYQRCSLHKDITYDQLRELLFVNHAMNQPKYTNSLEEAVFLGKSTAESEIYWLGFQTPMLSYSREFIQLIATRETGRRFMVVSQPVDYPNMKPRKGYVRGKYQSWEAVEELEDGTVEWICISQGSGGGYVPGFIADYIVGRDLHHNVFGVIKTIQHNNIKEK
ncbi:uncharacterized protein EV154DRAFT_142117 [Mucor mucedo]|uniref:uncharacterized protein n=1 Tax=Mucor mucedo TaxID=29922 RepID=UPI0022205721|nr:uncharacterized protein EV154DRAFT_142117 [Mucor mucedo]KAI7867605.1 hypothetical protein EV154DRAFT_142117 [Mucor mucedo]